MSPTGTDDLEIFRAKIGYTLFQAHLGEIILRLDIDEGRAWRIVREVLLPGLIEELDERRVGGLGGERDVSGEESQRGQENG